MQNEESNFKQEKLLQHASLMVWNMEELPLELRPAQEFPETFNADSLWNDGEKDLVLFQNDHFLRCFHLLKNCLDWKFDLKHINQESEPFGFESIPNPELLIPCRLMSLNNFLTD